MRQDQLIQTDWSWGDWLNLPVATLPTYLLRFGWKGGVYKRYFLQAHHLNSARQVGRTLGTPCSLVSFLQVWYTHQNHFSRPATAFTSFSTLILLNHDQIEVGFTWVTSPATPIVFNRVTIAPWLMAQFPHLDSLYVGHIQVVELTLLVSWRKKVACHSPTIDHWLM